MIDVLTVAGMRESDLHTIKTKVPSKELMWRAALGVYNSYDWHGKIGIFCGSGNNAGDGYALALILKEKGFKPDVILTVDKYSEDGLFYFNKCKEENINILEFYDELNEYDIYVDALLGTGFNGVPKGNILAAINYINGKNKTVISIDINSGLNGDNGLGEYVVKSDLTVSIGYLKSGLLLNKAKDYIKKLVNVDIGIDSVFEPFKLLVDSDIKSFLKPRYNMSNKGTYGYVGIMGGSKNYPGAPRLANLGQTALYSGCGVSKLIVPEDIYQLIFNNVLETVVSPITSEDGKMIFNEEEIRNSIKGLKALGVGVGWGESSEYLKILSYLISNFDKALVIDADGLNTLAKMDLSILNNSNANIILTPHLKEFSRLTGYSVSEISNDSINKVLEFVNKYNVTLLLKGPTTIIANKQHLYLVDKGCNGMATAGSGDVLTGILVGLSGRYQSDVTLTTAVAAYINGYSGELAMEEYGDIGMVASDTARMVSYAFKKISM